MIRVLIRADASVEIGSGHMTRCLALASELRERAALVCFVSRAELGNQIALIEAAGYVVHRLPPASGARDEERDASETLTAISGHGKFDVAIVDHYGLSAVWERHIRREVSHLIAIDDLPDRVHAVDLLLDQNIPRTPSEPSDGHARGAAIFLKGPEYALLRPGFRKVRDGLQARAGRLKTILIYFGGSDSADETSKALRAMIRANELACNVEVIVGAANPHRDSVQKLCESRPRTSFRCQIDDMAETMARADLAFGAAGVSAWERCCVGLPSFLTVLSEDQNAVARTVQGAGAGISLGWYEDVDETDYIQAASSLMPQDLAAMEIAGLGLVDGRGAERTAREIFGLLPKPRP